MNPTSGNPFAGLREHTTLALPDGEGFEPAHHRWSRAEIDALTLASAARRPLLVRGEPGSGKSQLARAAAVVLGSMYPIVEVIHPRFEAMDLLYRFDVVARLADAQLRDEKKNKSLLDATNKRYVTPGSMWRALIAAKPGQPAPVLLIDEIDKADADVPNALLEVLGSRSFPVPVLKPPLRIAAAAGFDPLIVITTNEERELPAAFVRRCVVLNLNPPEEADALKGWFMERAQAQARFESIDPAVCEQAIEQVMADREVAYKDGFPRVGLAELIDLLAALAELTAALPLGERSSAQRRWLNQLSAYALVKHAGQDQRRAPQVAPAAVGQS